jgi:hypothetical protein
LSFSPSIFFVAFLGVSLHEELKNTTEIVTKTRPENLKTLKKRHHRTYLAPPPPSVPLAAPVLCSRKMSIGRQKVCAHFFLTMVGR